MSGNDAVLERGVPRASDRDHQRLIHCEVVEFDVVAALLSPAGNTVVSKLGLAASHMEAVKNHRSAGLRAANRDVALGVERFEQAFRAAPQSALADRVHDPQRHVAAHAQRFAQDNPPSRRPAEIDAVVLTGVGGFRAQDVIAGWFVNQPAAESPRGMVRHEQARDRSVPGNPIDDLIIPAGGDRLRLALGRVGVYELDGSDVRALAAHVDMRREFRRHVGIDEPWKDDRWIRGDDPRAVEQVDLAVDLHAVLDTDNLAGLDRADLAIRPNEARRPRRRRRERRAVRRLWLRWRGGAAGGIDLFGGIARSAALDCDHTDLDRVDAAKRHERLGVAVVRNESPVGVHLPGRAVSGIVIAYVDSLAGRLVHQSQVGGRRHDRGLVVDVGRLVGELPARNPLEAVACLADVWNGLVAAAVPNACIKPAFTLVPRTENALPFTVRLVGNDHPTAR